MNSAVRNVSIDREVSPVDFRGAMRHLAGGVSVITVGRGKDITGMTVTSVSSFSVDPPTLVVSVNREASSWPLLKRHGFFGINLLTADQLDVDRRHPERRCEQRGARLVRPRGPGGRRKLDLESGAGPAAYLDHAAVLAAAKDSGADLIHPGYGFLSEQPEFARACAGAGFTFVGPDAAALDLFGNKASAREAATAAGVPVLPATEGPSSVEEIRAFATAQDGPIVIKALSGGGGRGMRIVHNLEQIDRASVFLQRLGNDVAGGVDGKVSTAPGIEVVGRDCGIDIPLGLRPWSAV